MREGERERETRGRKWKKDDKYEQIRGRVHISIHIYGYVHVITLSRALMSAPSLINISMAAV